MTLDENDYLTYTLYTASKSPTVKRTRQRSWIVLTFLFIFLAIVFEMTKDRALAIYFSILGVATLLFYPFYQRWRYKNYYLRHIRNQYKARFGQESSINFDGDVIHTKDSGTEIIIKKSEIEEVGEISDHFFLKLKSGGAIIISKSKSEDIDKITEGIRLMVQNFGTRHTVELDWKWK